MALRSETCSSPLCDGTNAFAVQLGAHFRSQALREREMDRTRRNMRGSPRGAGSRRGRRFAVAELPEAAAAAAAAATDQHCRHVPSSLPS